MMENKARIQSLDRAGSILEYLLNKKGGERLAVIAKDLHLNKSTAFGLISSLETLGLLMQDAMTERYQLGPKLIQYGAAAKENLNYVSVISRFAHKLLDKYGETIHISIISGCECVLVDKLEGNQVVTISTRVGERFPVTCAASGKAMLAFLPDERVREILDASPFESLTENTITDRAAFEKALAEVREKGYALDNEEGQLGRSCVSVPILNELGEAVASISISYPTAKELKSNKELVDDLVSVARETSESFGYYG